MVLVKKAILMVTFPLLSLGVMAKQTTPTAFDKQVIEHFVAEMEAKHKFSRKKLETLFAKVERKQSILDAMSRPAEKTKTWGEYREIFLTNKRIKGGVDFWQKNQQALTRAEQQYGIPAEIIVAIIGVETFYGRQSGRFRVMDALSTLGFEHPRRGPFFRKELVNFLLMSREQGIDPLALKGSYAGAMGYPQFIPSSFRRFAIDFNNDKKVDIWKNSTDAIGSVANYFKSHGWETGKPVLATAKVSGKSYRQALQPKLEPQKTISQIKSLGWEFSTPVVDKTKARAIELTGKRGVEHWVTLPNFYVITRYNHSTLYAMAVYQLGQAIKTERLALNQSNSKG
ncbi:lytic murein transglycosylase B [Spartinivicinus poritis]|uniref:Lytic murein transglycosylase B n=1 Tax=Spartinivicinus poritis TaxID=2994640 RepID=A0ABT5U669_9GAMM|nr:lytic murein transglycosylase B [Spartinivicinus sp. A2-2]MDE1461859.1 lytic murein transglycosylase B [Spartinivicinus sp. A2-2]